MLQYKVSRTISAFAVACLLAAPVVAQSNTVQSESTATATLSADGQLTGNVITSSADTIAEVPNAQVSLVSQGKVIDSVTADEAGNFSFANVHPGPYQLVGTAAGLVGSNALTVAPYTKSQPVTPGRVVLSQTAPEVVYDSYSAAPVASLSPCQSCNTCSTCGGGSMGGGLVGGGSIGGRLGGGGRLGRGLLSSPRRLLLVGGLVGGLASIESSPDR